MRCSALPLLAMACGGRQPLVDMLDEAAWSIQEEDPFLHRPADPNCPGRGIGWGAELTIEPNSLEVATGRCSFLGLHQPSAFRVAAGHRIDLAFSHDRLLAEEPSEGHVAVMLGDLVLWDDTIAIPAEPARFTHSVVVDAAIPAGTPVVLHLHNHGDNTWNFVDISTGPDSGETP